MAGRTLNDALQSWGAGLVGSRWAGEADFPLLVKLLDAHQHLSVQVHPTDAYVRAHAGTHRKSESWYVMAADPGSQLYLGLRDDVDRDDIRKALADERIVDIVRTVPAVAGDCHHVPSGTVHALGAGVVVAEVQSPSDTTFRLYDWTNEYDRVRRELHVDQALEALRLDPPPPPARLGGTGIAELARTGRYVLRAARGLRRVALAADTCTVVMCVEGTAFVAFGHAGIPLALGTTTVVPSAAAPDTTIDAGPGTVILAELLR
jgi:mannose-6-phosphate isomerase